MTRDLRPLPGGASGSSVPACHVGTSNSRPGPASPNAPTAFAWRAGAGRLCRLPVWARGAPGRTAGCSELQRRRFRIPREGSWEASAFSELYDPVIGPLETVRLYLRARARPVGYGTLGPPGLFDQAASIERDVDYVFLSIFLSCSIYGEACERFGSTRW